MDISKMEDLRGWKPSLEGREEVPYELLEWLKTKDVTVRQAMDIITVAGNLIDRAWHKEEGRVKF